MNILRLSCVLAALAFSGAANATVLLNDDFNAEHGGTGVLNYTGFANWNVSDGTVDLIGNGYFDFYPGNGLYVDLDGSTGNAGVLTSSAIFNLVAGETYSLSFRLGGSARGDTNVTLVLGPAYTETFTLASGDPLTLYTRIITVGSATSGRISFSNAGGDNVGMILDDVRFESRGTAVPEPGSLALLGLGLAGLGLSRRRKAA